MDDRDVLKDSYRAYIGRKILLIVVCVLSAIILVGLSVYFGGTDLSLKQVYEIIWNHINGATYPVGTDEFIDDYVVWSVRLPRAVFAIIAGAGLAVGGAVMQSVMKNPLADPYTTGISSGACFGMAVAMVLGITITGKNFSDIGGIINSFIFAVIPMLLIILISKRMGSMPATLILAGVAITYIFNSLTTLLMMVSDSSTLATVYRWQVGSLTNIRWGSIPLVLTINLIGGTVLLLLSRKLNILALGEDSAKSLGLDTEMMRVVCLFIISFMVASIVCYCGIFGFIGLVIPHIIRAIIDSDNAFVIPASAALGGIVLLSADVIARALSSLDAIPAGVIMSFIGAPIFLFIIIRSKKEVWG